MKLLAAFFAIFFLAGCAAQTPAATTLAPTLPETVPATPAATTPAPTLAPTSEPTPAHTEPADPFKLLLDSMTTEEKVGQLFLARCEGSTALQDIKAYHLGGFVLFARDFQEETRDSMAEKLDSYQSASKIPLLLAVDEEGGSVTRVSSYPAFRERRFLSPRNAYAQGGMDLVLSNEREKAALLSGLGLNVVLGPVCDVTTDPGAFMYQRSLGQDAETTAAFVAQTVVAMDKHRVGSCLKHFPGYGENRDTHTGMARDDRSLERLKATDLVPFQAGIDAGCGAVLVSHTIVTALDDTLPATLSPAVHTYLRQNMGFDGVIVTDDLAMAAITQTYGCEEAAVLAVLAGNDLLIASDYAAQYAAVLDAVNTGRIPTDILDAAVYRVLRWKAELKLL